MDLNYSTSQIRTGIQYTNKKNTASRACPPVNMTSETCKQLDSYKSACRKCKRGDQLNYFPIRSFICTSTCIHRSLTESNYSQTELRKVYKLIEVTGAEISLKT